MAAPSLEELNEIAGPLLSANKSLNLGLSQYYILDSMTVIVVQGFFAIRAWKVSISKSFNQPASFDADTLLGYQPKLGYTWDDHCLCAYSIWRRDRGQGDVYASRVNAARWRRQGTSIYLAVRHRSGRLDYYWHHRKTTGQKATDDVITRLARVTFESQLPPTLIAVGLAIEYTIQYSSFIAIPFLCVQAKFYGISLLHTLNSYVAVFGWLFGSLRFEHMSPRREALKNVGSTMATDDGDIEFAKRSRNTFWLSSRFTPADGPRATKGDTHRHTQFTIMPEPRTRRVKAESIDTVSFKGVDLGDDDESRNSRSRDMDAGVRKTSEIDLGEEINVVDLDDIETPPRRPARGGEFKLASMGLAGGMSSVDTGR
ncbi:hypothetical protein AG1IA_07726 [Rhizoctonia solani AG-1 IA]|uniref:DUF6534 domain-containing protein n=1 Tax=Thanatephorus cucumeris (strain AG1-IA) TaxID=983506 RepID=L8WK38_THACA|nr:hypothetical protein AG1IA_07726 [Rhizoctonia solani AG-1 IA]